MEAQVKYKRKTFVTPRKNIISIFLVDDDLSYLYPLGFYLQRNTDHVIFCYSSGEECINNLHKGPDIVILDINLTTDNTNAMNGIDVLKKIKSSRPRTKVIMLSGRDTAGGVAESMKLGAYMYIVKDIEAITKLKSIIEKIAEEKSAE
jgi:DNA-binding NarL/FixJ family response regulator